MGAVEALARPSKAVQRLLKLATTWLHLLPSVTIEHVPCQTARQLRAAEVDQLVTAYHSGSTVRQLARQFGIHRSTVGKHLESKGVNTRQLLLSSQLIEEAAELYRAGATLEQIAMRYQVSDTTIRTHLLRSGVKMRVGGRSNAPVDHNVS